MSKISVDLDVLRHALRDVPLTRVDQLLKTSYKTPEASGEVFVRVLNRADDKDDDAIVGGGNSAHIAFDASSAWVKYKLSAKAGAKITFANGDAKADADIALCDYRIHRPAEGAWDAMREDLSSPRSLLDLDDVQKLQPGEALAMELGGALTTKIALEWSDVVSTSLSDILSEFPSDIAVAVKLRKGLDVSVTVKVSDQFSVVISRTTAGHYRFAVKKAKSRKGALAFEVGYGAEVSLAPAIEDAVAPIFEAITGIAQTKAEKLADKIGLDALTDDEDAAVAKIAKRLHLGTAEDRDAAVKKAIGDVKKKLLKKLEDAVRWKASAGFEYEYARIDENTAIADFILLDDTRLPEDYHAAVRGNFARVSDILRQDDGTHSIVRYLNETTRTRRSSFGFSLGIGKWLQLSAKDDSSFVQTTRRSLDGLELVTSRGTRRYDEKNVPENDFEWIVDLKAQMKHFAPTPSTLDFDYGLHYAVILERGALSHGDVRRMLDFAAMWDVRTPDESEFADAIGRKATMRVQLVIDRDALNDALAFAAPADSWAEPLAAAMPYLSTFEERRSVAARRAAYSDAWRAWLGEETPQLHVTSGIKLFESQAMPGSFAWVSGYGHAHLRENLASFQRGTELLRDVMKNARRPDAIGEAYDALQRFWSQRLYIAASGRWLLDRVREAGAKATASLQVDFDDTTITS